MTPETENPAADSDQWFTRPTVLDDVNDEIWERLAFAPAARDSGWRLPVLATADGETGFRQRIVVLRSVDVATKTLFAHTDVRSEKVAVLRQAPDTTWLFYDSIQQVQLQLTGRAAIHTDDETADRFWHAESEASLRGYLAPHAPGTICETADPNLPEQFRGRIPERHDLQSGRSNFAVISCVVESAEWLLLRRDGNLRAVFEYTVDRPSARWIAP